MAGPEAYARILQDPAVAAVLIVLPTGVAPQVRPATPPQSALHSRCPFPLLRLTVYSAVLIGREYWFEARSSDTRLSYKRIRHVPLVSLHSCCARHAATAWQRLQSSPGRVA